jgi:hypothetical protein
MPATHGHGASLEGSAGVVVRGDALGCVVASGWIGSDRADATSAVGPTADDAVDSGAAVVLLGSEPKGRSSEAIPAAVSPAGDGSAMAPSKGIVGVEVPVGIWVAVGMMVAVGVGVGAAVTPKAMSSRRREAATGPMGASITRTRAEVAPGGG